MKKIAIVFLGLLVVASAGCISKKQHERQVSTLQGQVGALQSEASRLDAELKANQAAVLAAQARSQVSERTEAASTSNEGAGLYRTPSGFELQGADIQKALKSAGFYDGEIDGKIGPDSREALRRFQRDNGMTVDGVCGRLTWAKLKTYLVTK